MKHLGTPLALIALAAALLGGCANRPASSALPQVDLSPKVTVVARNPWSVASEAGRKVLGSTVLYGLGDSMRPLYPPDTVILLQKMDWEGLRPGMSVAYQKRPDNPYGLVCHVLVARTARERWEMRGLNNSRDDAVELSPDNYVGTVVAAFTRYAAADSASGDH